MDEPDFLVGLNSKTKTEIKNTLSSLDQRQRLEMVTYAYMNVTHMRYGEDLEYAGLKEYIYNEMTLYDAQTNIDRIMDDEVAKYLQAPERSGKTLQILWNAILNVHMGRCGIVMIGSPKDNVAGVTDGLNKGLDRFKKHIIDTYENVNEQFNEVFGKDMWGVDRFIHMDGNSRIVDDVPKVKDKRTGDERPKDGYYATAEIVSGDGVPVFSSTSRPPVERMMDAIEQMRNVDHFVLLDEADSVIKPSACSSTELAKLIRQIIGMTRRSVVQCPNCPNTHECMCDGETKHPGTYGGAKKVIFLSATMNLVVNYLNMIPGPRITVAPPISQRAQTLLGGVVEYEPIQIDNDNVYESLKNMMKMYFDMKNPLEPTPNFKYFIDNDAIIDVPECHKKYINGVEEDDEKTEHRPLRHFTSKKPFMKIGSYLYPEHKTNSAMLIQGSPFVSGKGNRRDVPDDEMINQMSMVRALFEKKIVNGVETNVLDFVTEDTMVITSFSGGSRMWFNNRGDYGKDGMSVTDIIRKDKLDEKILRISTYSRQQAAKKIIDEFKNADEDIENTMNFASWYFGVHVPKLVFGFNKALRAVDTRDRNHIITHQFIISTDGQGADDVKQIAGRSKAAKGEMLAFNFDVSHEDSADNFKVKIACNRNLDFSKVLENMPYQNDIDDVDGKRVVDIDIMNAADNTFVLPKAARKYESKNLKTEGEAEIVEAPALPDMLTIRLNYIWGKLAYYLMTEVEDREYSDRELTNFFVELRAANRVDFQSDGRIYVHEMMKKNIIRKMGTLYAINKHIPFVTTGSL